MYGRSTHFHFQRFPDFGAELKRPFEVHELCYDCAEFYGPGHGEVGCNAWPASKPFRCADFLRLPDVMPGEPTGQVFPPSRMKGRRVPRELPKAEVRPRETVAALPEKRDKQSSTRRTSLPSLLPGVTKKESHEARRCGCGEPLAKGKQYCDECRAERRRATMRTYMQERRNGLTQPTASSGSPQKPTYAAPERRSPVKRP